LKNTPQACYAQNYETKLAISKMTPSSLPANEARRTTIVIRLALKAIDSIDYKNTHVHVKKRNLICFS
jgi:hypothetical protein